MSTSWYWSSSQNAVRPLFAWYVIFGSGDLNYTGKIDPDSVCAVRAFND